MVINKNYVEMHGQQNINYCKDMNVFQSFAHNTCIFAVCGGAALSDWLRYVGRPVVDDSVERNNSEVSALIISHCGSPIVCSI